MGIRVGAPPFDSRDLLSPYAGSEYASSTCSVGSGFISEAGYLEHPNEGGEQAQPAKQKKIGKKRGPKPLKTELLSTDSREERRKKQMRLNWRAHSSKKKQEQETLHAQLTSLIQRNAELGTALASTKASVAGMTSILDAVATGGSVQITSDSLGSWPLSVQNLWMTVPGEYGSRRVYDAEASELGGSVGFDVAGLESMGI